jgi:nucleotide-binding universal stress UspA family protein
MFNKILLATDGSENAWRAAEKALFFTKINPFSSIELVYVIDGSTSKHDVLHNQDKNQIEKKRKERLQPTIELLEEAGVKYEVHVLHGDPGSTIVEFSKKQNMDLVLIGSRGLNTLQEMMLGSVSHKVAKHAQCPILIVK